VLFFHFFAVVLSLCKIIYMIDDAVIAAEGAFVKHQAVMGE
jgi:hypothetical protein